MAEQDKFGYAFNVTRQAFLATKLRVANTHWTRLVGLLGTSERNFKTGVGLWIVPSHGVHTFMMRFPIDVLPLDEQGTIIHLEENVKPWRMTPIRLEAISVIELPSHTIWNTSTKVGDQVEIEADGRKRPVVARSANGESA